MKFNTSILDMLRSKTKVKIIKFLLTHEASMSEREIASILKISHMSVNRAMREFSNINFVDFLTVGKAHLWKVNRKSYAFKSLSEFIKGFSNIKEPIDDLKDLLLDNLPENMLRKAVLYGSIAEGKEKINSDIDIFLLVKDKETKKKLEPFIDRLSNKCLEVYGNRLSPYILSEQEMKRKKRLGIISGIEKGIKIFPLRKD